VLPRYDRIEMGYYCDGTETVIDKDISDIIRVGRLIYFGNVEDIPFHNAPGHVA